MLEALGHRIGCLSAVFQFLDARVVRVGLRPEAPIRRQQVPYEAELLWSLPLPHVHLHALAWRDSDALELGLGPRRVGRRGSGGLTFSVVVFLTLFRAPYDSL